MLRGVSKNKRDGSWPAIPCFLSQHSSDQKINKEKMVQIQSNFNGTITVKNAKVNNQNWRVLQFGNGDFTQGGLRLVRGKLDHSTRLDYINHLFVSAVAAVAHSHAKMVTSPRQIFAKGDRVLLVGLGAGVLANLFIRSFRGLFIDVVEIDKKVIQVAQQYFEFGTDGQWKNDVLRFTENGNQVAVHAMPIQDFTSRHAYRVIVVDLGSKDGLPMQLLQSAIQSDLVSMLENNGVFVLNAYSENKRVLQQMSRHVKQVMNNVLCLRMGTEDDNPVLVARSGKALVKARLVMKSSRTKGFDFDFQSVLHNLTQ